MKNQKIQSLKITELKEYSKNQYPEVFEILKIASEKYDPIIQIDGEKFSINFVGILIIDEFVLFVYPKYFKFDPYLLDKTSNDEFRRIIRVIQKYKRNNDITNEDYIQNQNNDKLSLMIWLLNDYIKNDLYSKQIKINKLNDIDEINWQYTLENENAHLNKDKTPLFLNLWTQKKESDSQDIIRFLHLLALDEILSYLTDLGIINIFVPDIQLEIKKNKIDIRHSKYIKLLTKAIKAEYNTDKKITLEKLLLYLKEEESDKKQSVQAFGTNSFNLVWEDVCKYIFGHDEKLNNTIKSQRPKWEINGVSRTPNNEETETEDHRIIKETHGLIPDIVSSIENQLIILDAKYYIPDWENVSGVPGVGDISKQHLYQLAYEQYALNKKLGNRNNAFIMPKQWESIEDYQNYKVVELEYKGKVGLEFLQNIKKPALSDIKIFTLSPELAFDYYLYFPSGNRKKDLWLKLENLEESN